MPTSNVRCSTPDSAEEPRRQRSELGLRGALEEQLVEQRLHIVLGDIAVSERQISQFVLTGRLRGGGVDAEKTHAWRDQWGRFDFHIGFQTVISFQPVDTWRPSAGNGRFRPGSPQVEHKRCVFGKYHRSGRRTPGTAFYSRRRGSIFIALVEIQKRTV